ncbi:MAG: MbcA/ParS/Xre antitoxin family protein [Methylococcales bacterium]
MVAISPIVSNATPDTVLCKALLSTQQQLELSQTELGQSIGLDRSSISRLQKRGTLKPDSKAGELATYLIRIYRALYVLMGGDLTTMRHWMETNNRHLQAVPKQLIASAEGLVRVMHYLDAMRGKI